MALLLKVWSVDQHVGSPWSLLELRSPRPHAGLRNQNLHFNRVPSDRSAVQRGFVSSVIIGLPLVFGAGGSRKRETLFDLFKHLNKGSVSLGKERDRSGFWCGNWVEEARGGGGSRESDGR